MACALHVMSTLRRFEQEFINTAHKYRLAGSMQCVLDGDNSIADLKCACKHMKGCSSCICMETFCVWNGSKHLTGNVMSHHAFMLDDKVEMAFWLSECSNALLHLQTQSVC